MAAFNQELHRAVTSDHDAIRAAGADRPEVQRLLDARHRRRPTQPGRPRQTRPPQSLATPPAYPTVQTRFVAAPAGAHDGTTQPHNPFILDLAATLTEVPASHPPTPPAAGAAPSDANGQAPPEDVDMGASAPSDPQRG